MRRDEIVVVAPIDGREPQAVADAIHSSQGKLAESGIPLAIGVSTVQPGLERVPAAYREARAASERLEGDAGVVALLSMSAFEYLTHAATHNGVWRELADTRIPPGETRRLAFKLTGAETRQARRARVTLTMAPDEFYEGFYRRALLRKVPDEAKKLYQTALDRATKSRFEISHSSWGILSRGARK